MPMRSVVMIMRLFLLRRLLPSRPRFLRLRRTGSLLLWLWWWIILPWIRRLVILALFSRLVALSRFCQSSTGTIYNLKSRSVTVDDVDCSTDLSPVLLRIMNSSTCLQTASYVFAKASTTTCFQIMKEISIVAILLQPCCQMLVTTPSTSI